MPTLGGGKRHSVAGAISTATHGSTTRLPPIADFIRAIHLVSTGGQQWWLEPASKPVTSPDEMSRLKHEGLLDPCLKVRYDDDLFHAALVSFGTAGIFYSVIVETINRHRFAVKTLGPSWSSAQEVLRTRVIDPATPADWFFEITMDPTGRTRLSTLNLTTEAVTGEPEGISIPHAILSMLSGIPARLSARIPLYVARRSLELLNPFSAREVFQDIRDTIALADETIRFIRDITRLTTSHFAEEELARAMPNIINLLWRVGGKIGVGRDIVDDLQGIILDGQRPRGTFVRDDHLGLTFSDDACPASLDGLLPKHVSDESPFERLFRSSEYIVPASDCAAFSNAIVDVANQVRDGSGALVLQINLRFTRATKALAGMQIFDRSAHIELFTINGLNGNEEFDRRLEPVLRDFRAVAHWGQQHNAATDYEDRFSRVPAPRGRPRLDVWRQSINVLASGSADHPNTFRHDFATSRGLLTDL